MNLMWCILKVRNVEVIEGRKIQPMKVIHQARAMDYVMVPMMVAHQRQQDILEVPRDHKLIMVDGSWDQQGKARVTAVIYDENDQLVEVRSRAMDAQDSYHAEAQTVLEALGWMLEQMDRARWAGAIVVSNCQPLVQAVMEDRIEDYLSWLAAATLVRIREVRAGFGVKVNLEHVQRESLRGPHVLTNWIWKHEGVNIAGRPPSKLALAEHGSWGLGPHIVREMIEVGWYHGKVMTYGY
jgi:Reverse transcriptase-like